MASSEISPTDMLCANDPWRAQMQQLPAPAGQPASFARVGPELPLGLHKVLGAPTAYRQGSIASGWARSSDRLCRRHRRSHRR
eukprot:4691885-Pyramimonas_sp.AAC.1